MWINKYLASEGYTTRRGADELVKAKKVFINGRLAVPTDKVSPGDKVEVKGIPKTTYHYYAYHKPRGIITHSAQGEEEEIKELVPLKGVFPVGRLDKASQGLIILTNDGRITDRLLSPEYEHDKEYEVRVEPALKANFKTKMERGVNIEGYKTKPAKVTILTPNKFRIVLTEGKKHQIRRMCAAFDYAVRELKRTRVMNIKLDKLGEGQYREIKGEELKAFLTGLGLFA